MENKRILTFGNIVMDGLFIVPRLPGYDEKVFAETLAWSPGGPAVHFAITSAKLGARANVLGWLGNDSMGRQLQQTLEAKGVEPSFNHILDTQTPTAIIMIDGTGEKSVLLSPPIDESRLPRPEEVAVFDLKHTKHIHTHLFLEPYVLRLLEECGRIGITRSLDVEPSSIRRWGGEGVRRALACTDIVFINEPAVALLCPDEQELSGKMRRIAAFGPSMVVCTRGRRGSVVLTGGRLINCPSIPVVTSNSLAAGDIFAGAFVHRLLDGGDAEDAVVFGTAASSVAVSRSGSSVYYPSLAEIDKALAEHQLAITISEVDMEWKLI